MPNQKETLIMRDPEPVPEGWRTTTWSVSPCFRRRRPPQQHDYNSVRLDRGNLLYQACVSSQESQFQSPEIRRASGFLPVAARLFLIAADRLPGRTAFLGENHATQHGPGRCARSGAGLTGG